MSKAEPTAGEWIADDENVLAPGYRVIGTANTRGAELRTAKANARLFAASKDLLAACERAELEMGLHNIAPITRELLRAAIAKAKKET